MGGSSPPTPQCRKANLICTRGTILHEETYPSSPPHHAGIRACM